MHEREIFIRKPVVQLEQKTWFQNVFILTSIHRILYDIETACTLYWHNTLHHNMVFDSWCHKKLRKFFVCISSNVMAVFFACRDYGVARKTDLKLKKQWIMISPWFQLLGTRESSTDCRNKFLYIFVCWRFRLKPTVYLYSTYLWNIHFRTF